MTMQSTMNPAPQCREWLGTMPANKSHKVRQAYWWVFTYPGSLCGAVVEIREAATAGSVFKARRYAVTERMADRFPARVFEFFKPYKDRKPDGSPDKYTVRFSANDRKLCYCGCRSFSARRTCVHLESLLCLMGPKSEAKRVDAAAPKTKERPAPKARHEWEKVGRSTHKCRACGTRSFDPALTDRHPDTRRCAGGKSDKDGRAGVPAGRPRTDPGPTRRKPGPTPDRPARKPPVPAPSRPERPAARAGVAGKAKQPGRGR